MASNFPIEVLNHEAEDIMYFPVTAGQTFTVKALVFLTSGAVTECGADPANILGIALAPASVGLDANGSIYGGTNIPILVLDPDHICWMASATTPVFATHVGTAYGIEKTTNWRVDTTDTGATRVVVTNVSLSPTQEGFYARFLATNLQLDAIAS